MNPNDRPYKSDGNPSPNPLASTPPPMTSNDDAEALRAIEALEAESNGLPDAEPIPAPTTDTLPPIQPPVTLDAAPAPIVTPPQEPAVDLATSLNSEPVAEAPSAPFQPFAKKRGIRKQTLILIIIGVVLLLAVAGFFIWQYLQSQTTLPVVQETSTSVETEPAITDTEASVTETITTIETDLNGIDDREYQDSTLSDDAVYN